VRRVYGLFVFVPVAAAAHFAAASATVVLFTSALAVVPAAALLSESTEHLSTHAGPAVGGLLNATIGNAPELIIAIIALVNGLHEVVKASLVGSIVGNLLLVLGAAMLVGGIGRERQTFNRTAAQTLSGMLLLTLPALILPAVFELIHGGRLPFVGEGRVRFGHTVDHLSVAISIVLIIIYITGLVFSLRTHRNVLGGETADVRHAPRWSLPAAIAGLTVAGVIVGLMSAILVGSIEHASHALGLSQFFVGAFVVAIVGNAAEHFVAVAVAAKDNMDLAVSISIGSSTQIALFVTPVLVLLSFVAGPAPMALVFNGYEIAALIFAALATIGLTQDGESTWFEGVQLLAVYAVIGLVFYWA
jgi:Ca2+:H+ antiporter